MTIELKIFLLFAIATFFAIGIFIILAFIKIYNRKQKYIQEKKQAQDRFNHLILQTQIEIQEQTLKTISQEIHDNIGQVLSLTKLTLGSIESADVEVVNKIGTTKILINKAIIDLKDISNSLNTDSIESIGLLKAVENEVELINKTNLKAALTINGIVEKLDPKTELILFRMVQECISNAIKHSKAEQIDILANYEQNYFELTITDNGIGFNTDKISNQGLGLKNIQNRIKFIEARLSINSSYAGTEIKISIPQK